MIRYIRTDTVDPSDEDLAAQINIVKDPTVRVSTLMKLAESDVQMVRYYVAMNPNTPESLLRKLAKDPIWIVRYGVTKNPNTSRELRKQIERSYNDDSGSVEFVLDIVDYETEEVPSSPEAIRHVENLIRDGLDYYDFPWSNLRYDAGNNNYRVVVTDPCGEFKAGVRTTEDRDTISDYYASFCHEISRDISDYLLDNGWELLSYSFERILE